MARAQNRRNDPPHTLDVMPCDYRRFAGEEKPAGKLVEAAENPGQLEVRFREARARAQRTIWVIQWRIRLLIRPCYWNGKGERAPLPQLALDPDFTTVQFHQALGDDQPQPSAGHAVHSRVIGTKVFCKEALLILRPDAYAGVRYRAKDELPFPRGTLPI
jgi:hypothetical protein